MKTVLVLGVFDMIVCLNSSHKISKYLEGNPMLSLFSMVIIESTQLINNV